jgi:hypothetical protein
MRVRSWVCLVSGPLFAVAACSSGGARQESSAPTPVRFGGNWVLDHNDSQLRPHVSGRESGSEGEGGRLDGGERGERGGGFGGGFGGGRGGRGGPEGQEGGSGPGAAMRDALQPAEHLLLDLTDSTVMITAGDQASQLLPTDGRKLEETTSDDRKVETRARWKDGGLRVERSVSGAYQVTDVYTLSWSGNRLEDVRSVERTDRPGPTMELRLIYDRQPADST